MQQLSRGFISLRITTQHGKETAMLIHCNNSGLYTSHRLGHYCKAVLDNKYLGDFYFTIGDFMFCKVKSD